MLCAHISAIKSIIKLYSIEERTFEYIRYFSIHNKNNQILKSYWFVFIVMKMELYVFESLICRCRYLRFIIHKQFSHVIINYFVLRHYMQQ